MLAGLGAAFQGGADVPVQTQVARQYLSPTAPTPWSNTVQVQPFNGALGTLLDVKIETALIWDGRIWLENRDTQARTLSVRMTGTARTSLPGPVQLMEESTIADFLPPGLAPFDGQADFLGASGYQAVSASRRGLGSVHFTASDTSFPLFTGASPVAMSIDASQSTGIQVLSGSNDLTTLDQAVFSNVAALLTVTYTYSPSQADLIGDRVWNDLNGDGVQDANEPGLPGIQVNLVSELGDTLGTVDTDGGGFYHFSNLPTGYYSVNIAVPAGAVPTYYLPTSIAGPGFVSTSIYHEEGTTDLTIDFGLQERTGAVEGHVLQDHVPFGASDASDTGITGILVTLFDSQGNALDFQVTDEAGRYTFGGLATGSYNVAVESTMLPTGYVATFDPDGITTVDTAGISVETGATLTGVDFGYRSPLGRIGDLVWHDTNGNHTVDSGEEGLGGVTLRLYNLQDPNTVIATTVTDASGHYWFGELAAGTYQVEVDPSVLPSNYVAVWPANSIGAGDLATVSIAAGEERDDVDFGYRAPGTNSGGGGCGGGGGGGGDQPPDSGGDQRPGSVAGFVWNDINGNGNRVGEGEPGLGGLSVELRNPTTGAVVGSTSTQPTGAYSFSDIPAGPYVVAVGSPAGFIPTFDPNGIETAGTTTIAITPAQQLVGIDFGYQALRTIAGFVWNDINADANPAGESGADGVTVILRNVSTGAQATKLTIGGAYEFPNIVAGNYTVTVDVPSDSGISFNRYGTGEIAGVALTSAQDFLDVDFGLYKNGSISGKVWNDSDRNGVSDPAEVGLGGVDVFIYSGSTLLGSVTTGTDGSYEFLNVGVGNYRILVGSKASFDASTPVEIAVPIAAAQSRTAVDFGLVYRGPVSGLVWNDLNSNGDVDPGEAGLANIPVSLILADGTAVQATTGSDGRYTFGDRYEGSYTVVVTPPQYWEATYDVDGLASGSKNRAGVVQIPGGDLTNVNFGYAYAPPLGSIGDTVWSDLNSNGQQDPGEGGIADVLVTLRDASGVEKHRTTDADGKYGFTGLAAGSYTVTVTLPALGSSTYPVVAGIPTNSVAINLGIGVNLDTVDFGVHIYIPPPTAGISGFVFDDANANHVFEGSEAGIAGVTVRLKDNLGNILTSVQTDTTGHYEFPQLLQDNYAVVVAGPAGFIATGAESALVALAPPQSRTDLNFGYQHVTPAPDIFASVGDKVWNDLNGNGTQESNEPGLGNVTVILYDALNHIVDQKVTDASGTYHFLSVVPGIYYVGVTAPNGMVQTYDRDGVATANRARVDVGSTDLSDVDFGYWSPPRGSIGDRVWSDVNSDGIQNSGETGLSGVLVTLYDSTQTSIATDTTDCYGRYSFANIPAGTYLVRVTPPSNYGPTFDLDGTATPNVAWVTLNPGQNRTDVDFGYVYARGTGSIGNLIWKDYNGNGRVDSGESGLPGVTVSLLNASQVVVATTQTDYNGQYLFRNLNAGTYSVRATQPSQHTPSYDLDGLQTPNIATVVLGAGQSRLDVDFGYMPTSTAGNDGCGSHHWPGCWQSGGNYCGGGSSGGGSYGGGCYGGGSYGGGSCNYTSSGSGCSHWTSYDGQKCISPRDCASLTCLELRKPDGTRCDLPSNHSDKVYCLKNWMGNNNSGNMSCNLSIEMACLQLNINHGYCHPDRVFTATGCNATGKMTADELIRCANAAVKNDGYTPYGDPNRAYQQCLRTAIANANAQISR